MEDSPSKNLAEDLQSFHISSPVPQTVANKDVAGRNVLKQYLPNNEFADSKFVSYVGDSGSKSYIKRLGDWSMNYGTVQQKPKSPVKKDTELPQFKKYLNINAPEVNTKHELSRDPESDLILTASLNDISGIPTNTFKRHDHQKKKRHQAETSETFSPGAEQDEQDDDNDDDDDDVDPALEARGVFDNILKTQKSNYDFQQGKDGYPADQKERYESDGTSSYLGETPSSLSPNFGAYSEKPAGIKLITPEEMGLVFDNINGVWYKPPAKNQDISSSRTMDNTDSTISNASKLQPGKSQLNSSSAIDRFMRPKNEARYTSLEHKDVLEDRYQMEDDTSLDAPQINPQYLLQRDSAENDRRPPENNTTQNMVANVTTVSQVETSFQESKRELISIITEILPARKVDWSRVRKIDLHARQLGQVIGLSEILPGLTDCELNNNNLRGLLGVPSGVLRLTCRDNQISAPYVSLESLPHLETLDLAHNSIGPNLSILSSSIHLREVNLSHNKIRSISGDLGDSQILKLKLSHNQISGTIDFAQLTKHDNNSWLTLEELDLSYNKITRVQNVQCLRSLRILRIDGNPIRELIEEDTRGRSALRTLTITQTQGALSRIATTQSNADAFRDEIPYTRLRVLRIDGFRRLRKFTALPLCLEELSVKGGHVDMLPDWSILPSALRRLAVVHVQGLTSIPPLLAHRVPSLLELDLSHNDLAFCYNLVQAVPTLALTRLRLTGNPLAARSHRDKQDLAHLLATACPNLRHLEQ